MKVCILFLIISCLVSCSHSPINADLEQTIRNMIVEIPLDSMEILSPKNGDSHDVNSVEVPDYRYYIIYDSINCTICSLRKMGIWNSIIKRTIETGINVDFIFIMMANPDNVQLLKRAYYSERINLKIYIDTIGVVKRHFPLINKSLFYSAFVLNKENRIEVIGNASKDYDIESRFYKFLNKKRIDSMQK